MNSLKKLVWSVLACLSLTTVSMSGPRCGVPGTILDTPGAVYVNQTFIAPVIIRADRIKLINCTIDGQYEANYGLFIDFKRPGRRYRFTQMLGGSIVRCIGKGALVSFTLLRGVTIEDIGSDGVFIAEEGFVEVDGCIIRDYGWTKNAHADGIQAALGTHFRITRNTIVNPQGAMNPNGSGFLSSNACIFLEAQFDNLDSILIAGNLLDGGLYSLRVRDETQGFAATNVIVVGNKFLRHYFGPFLFETKQNPVFPDSNDLSESSVFRP